MIDASFESPCRVLLSIIELLFYSARNARIASIGVNFVIKVGGLMASAEREAVTGVWGRSPQRGPGAEPLVRRSGGQSPPRSGGQSPPEAEKLFSLECHRICHLCQ